MLKSKQRCLGVIVVYDPLRAPVAVARFKEVISNAFYEYSIRIITNNSEVGGDIIGSNKCGEFSGWSEGVEHEDYENYDIILFANDTFSTRRPFNLVDERKFLDKISIATQKSNFFLIGELQWSINYQLLLKGDKFVLKWVRTNIFAISTYAAKKIGGVSLTESEISAAVKSDESGQFLLSQVIPEVYRRRIEEWLNPETPTLGWHGSQNASGSVKKLKAMCVLQELDLTKRCIEAGVSVLSSTSIRKRDHLLAILHHVQNRFL